MSRVSRLLWVRIVQLETYDKLMLLARLCFMDWQICGKELGAHTNPARCRRGTLCADQCASDSHGSSASSFRIPYSISHCFAQWIETYNKVFGRTVNPRNRNLTCGGSSGGEGALVAMKGSPLGVGSDVGGYGLRVLKLCRI